MNIANNILKHHLRNVYFLSGTACGGKTTMSKAIAEKHGMALYNDTDYYDTHRKIAAPDEQPAMTKQFPSWEYYFNRPVEEYAGWLSDSLSEELGFILIDLIMLSVDKKVIVDLHMQPETAKLITDYNRIAFLVAEPDLILRDYYDRDHHREILACIQSLPEPDKALKNCNDSLAYSADNTIRQVRESGMFCIKRDEHSTVERTLKVLEEHFGLASN